MSHNNYMKKILIILLIFITISSYRLLSLKDKHTYQKGYIYGLTAPRGRILDRNGKILVNIIGVKSLVFNKLSISTKETMDIARNLNDIIILNLTSDKEEKRYCFYIENDTLIKSRIGEEIKTKYKERRINKKNTTTINIALLQMKKSKA